MEKLSESEIAENLRKAQKKFTKVGTNLKNEEIEILKVRIEELGLNYSSYVKKLIYNDLEHKSIEKFENSKKSKKFFGLF
jgi:predicted DNA binding CopG/RHH family protein